MDDTRKALDFLMEINSYNWEDEEIYRESFMSFEQRWRFAKIYLDSLVEHNKEKEKNNGI